MLEHIKSISLRSLLLKILGLTIGAMIYSAGLNLFLVPNSIIDGGVVGIGLILAKLTSVSFSVWVVALNIPFFYLGYKRLGKSLAFSATFAVIILSFWSHLFEGMDPVTTDPFLATIFGGMIIGIGVGLVIRSGGSLDGTEIVAIWLDRQVSFSVGEIVLFFNIFILGTAGFVFSWNSAMYSLVAYFIAYKMIDVVTNGLDEMKGMLIVTGKHDEVADCLTRDMGRAVTLINGEGAYKREKTMILYCVVSRLEITKIRDAITGVDPNAFVSVFDISEAHGGLFKRHKMHG